MSSTVVKIIAVVVVTVILFAFLAIAALSGFLYFVSMSVKKPDRAGVETAPTSKRQSSVAPADITKVEFSESVYSSTYSANTRAFFGNVNPQNNSHSVETVTFSSDGTATKVTSGERTVNGTKIYSGPTLDNAVISPEDFSVLALTLSKNDFVNEEDSRNMTSLPIKKVLTINYKSGVKVIKTDNMGKDTLEITEILTVFRALELKMAWKRK